MYPHRSDRLLPSFFRARLCADRQCGAGAGAQFGSVAFGSTLTDPRHFAHGPGQTSKLRSRLAERREVMRGPFSTLYGNASGGSSRSSPKDGPPEPTLTLTRGRELWNQPLRSEGSAASPGANYIGALPTLNDRYRDHSAAEKDLGNARLKFAPRTIRALP